MNYYVTLFLKLDQLNFINYEKDIRKDKKNKNIIKKYNTI